MELNAAAEWCVTNLARYQYYFSKMAHQYCTNKTPADVL